MQLGIAIARAGVMDATWTTVRLARAALDRGHSVRFFETTDVDVDEGGRLVARAVSLDPPGPDVEPIVDALRDRTTPRRPVRLDTLDVALMRVNPVDNALISLALRLRDLGVTVVNDPAGMLRVASKAWLATLPDVNTPTTLVTASAGQAHRFMDDHPGPVVVKPAQGSGGYHVALVNAGDHARLDHAFLLASTRSRHVVLQAYVREAEQGEKRLVWMDGKILGGYLRVRADGEFRHNLKQGGTPAPLTVTAADHAIVAPLGAHLLAIGVRLAGIDLIGTSIIEVNALNPGGAYHADRLHGSDVTGRIIEHLATPPDPTTRREAWAPHVP